VQSPRFYFEKSLIGYFFNRFRRNWNVDDDFPSVFEYHGVRIDLSILPAGMRSVILSGNYELPEIQLVTGFIEPKDRILEIGSALGFVGLHCKVVVGVSEVICVEPNPKTLVYLERNYELNGMMPTVVSAALSSSNGPLKFYVSDMFWCDSSNKREDVSNPREISVDGLTFEAIVKKTRSDFNTLIIDIEGGEQYLPLDEIPTSVDKILIELHPEVIGNRPSYLILETLIRSGFHVHGRAHNTWALKRMSDL
jgi:FkbM family methyltransferase